MAALASGTSPDPSAISGRRSPSLGATLGVTRHDAREEPLAQIAMSGQAQGLFDAPDERRVVVVQSAEAIRDASFIAQFPPASALVLVTSGPVQRRSRGRARKEQGDASGGMDLAGAVESAGGRVERIERLAPDAVLPWIGARAELAGVTMDQPAAAELASAAGSDTERIEGELAKLAAFAGGRTVTAEMVREVVPGAIEADVFELTRAVVRRDARGAVARLERLLDDGQHPLQILSLLLWQFRVVLGAIAVDAPPREGERKKTAAEIARDIRSSEGVVLRWRADARRISQRDVVHAYDALYATDLAIKQGRTEPELALTLCVLDLCGVKDADPSDLIVGEPPRR